MPTEKKDIESGETESKKEQESLKEKNDMQPEAARGEQKPEKESQSEVKPADKPAQAESKEKTKKEIEAKTEKEPESGKKETEPEEKTQETEKPGFSKLDEYAGVRKDLPEIKIGDVVKVSYRVIEGGKERIQMFEGIVIARKNSGISRTITVRKTSFGVAVERIFPLNSKLIQKIQVKKHSKVRRAKLYYLRELKGKAARLKELR